MAMPMPRLPCVVLGLTPGVAPLLLVLSVLLSWTASQHALSLELRGYLTVVRFGGQGGQPGIEGGSKGIRGDGVLVNQWTQRNADRCGYEQPSNCRVCKESKGLALSDKHCI